MALALTHVSEWNVDSSLKLCGLLFGIWALEEVNQILMINEQRCLVVILVVLPERGHV